MTTLTSGIAVAQATAGLDAVDARHLHVKQGDGRLGALGGLDDLVAPADLGDHGQVRFQVEQGGRRPADEGLVVGQEHPDAHRRSGAAGSKDGKPRSDGPADIARSVPSGVGTEAPTTTARPKPPDGGDSATT